MSETVLNAAGTSAAGTVATTPMRKLDLKYFGWLYMVFGLAVIIFGDLAVEYPKAYKGNLTATSSFSTTDAAVISAIGLLVAIIGFLDYRSTKSMSNKVYLPAIIFVLGLVLVPLFTDYGAFNGVLESAAYELSGVSLGGLFLIFASLGEIYLMRK